MPNHCWNTLVIIGHKEDLDEIRENKLSFEYFSPPPNDLDDGQKYYWRCENWGTKWDAYSMSITNKIDDNDDNLFECRFTTAWAPPIKFLETLLKKYPRSWIKLLWKVEDGQAGVFIHYNKYEEVITKSMIWNEPLPTLTSDNQIYIPDEMDE